MARGLDPNDSQGRSCIRSWLLEVTDSGFVLAARMQQFAGIGVLTTAWRLINSRCQILVRPEYDPQKCIYDRLIRGLSLYGSDCDNQSSAVGSSDHMSVEPNSTAQSQTDLIDALCRTQQATRPIVVASILKRSQLYIGHPPLLLSPPIECRARVLSNSAQAQYLHRKRQLVVDQVHAQALDHYTWPHLHWLPENYLNTLMLAFVHSMTSAQFGPS